VAAAKRGTPASPGKQASDPSFLLAGPLDQELGRDLNRVVPYSPFRMILPDTPTQPSSTRTTVLQNRGQDGALALSVGP